MTLRAQVGKKNIEASEALSVLSLLLIRLAKSRKAPSKLPDIINLTREVARLSRSINGYGGNIEAHDDGYGTGANFGQIDKRSNLVR